MYTAGKLIYFDPFYFKSGNESKPKYFLVLKVIEHSVVLASLPSSQMHLPQNQEINHGCLEIPESCINCYIFKAKIPITKSGWYFEFDTFLYGFWLDDYTIEELQENHPIANVDYEIVGELHDSELHNVVNCFSKSSSVKRKYKKMLSKQ
ncbi:MAG: hypothetical protein LH615_04395 [Ferruginibacter sp.]|nr:hypothetical protein [Ferruginibacter sp.]